MHSLTTVECLEIQPVLMKILTIFVEENDFHSVINLKVEIKEDSSERYKTDILIQEESYQSQESQLIVSGSPH